MTFWDDIGLVSGAMFKKQLRKLEARMGAREDAAFAQQAELITQVQDGWTALQAENAVLKSQLESQGVEFQAALDADSEADAAKVEAGNTALQSLVGTTEEPPVEEPVEEPTEPVTPDA